MGKAFVIGDFAELEARVANGTLSRDEYQEIFAKSRKHGLKGDIYPFAVGGSDAATIMGVSPWTTPLKLYFDKFGLLKKKDNSNDTIFRIGHVFEDAFREMFSAQTGLPALPCTKQFGNTAYPHLIANIDGIVWENGEAGIYEGKTTKYYTPTREKFANGEVPIYYIMQIQFYMEVCNFDFAWINCGWGLDPEREMKYIRVERDRELGRQICMACEEFVVNAANGIRPSNAVCENLSAVSKDAEILYGAADSSLPPVKLDPKFSAAFHRLDALAEKEEAVKASMKPVQDQIKELEEKIKPQEKELKEIEKEMTTLLRLFPDEIKNATVGIFEEGDDVWVVNYEPCKGFSLDAEVKAYWKETYPECFADVTSRKPNYKRQLSYEKRKRT